MKAVYGVVLVAWVACGRKEREDARGTSSETTDTAEVIAEPTYIGLSGTVTYESTQDGVTTCTSVVELTGTPYSGADCPSCLFAFDVEATVVVDEGTCSLDPWTTWTSNIVLAQPALAFSESYASSSPTLTQYEDVLWRGYLFDYEATGTADASRHWLMVASGSSSDGRSTLVSDDAPVWDGSRLTWSRQVSLPNTFEPSPLLGESCYGVSLLALPLDVPVEGASFVGSIHLPPGGGFDPSGTFDLYSFDATAGQQVQIGVDTTAADSAFTPRVVILDQDGCAVGIVSGTVGCSFSGDSPLTCPSLTFDVPDTGTYRLLVGGIAPAPPADTDELGLEGEYRLTYANLDVAPTLLKDNAQEFIGPFTVGSTTTLDVEIAQE